MILSSLDPHPNIVGYRGNGVANNHVCLFLDYYPIGSMADVLSLRKSFSVPTIHRFLSNLLDAIDYLHTNQIYHRDIKARNILVIADGSCRLADFGSAVDVSHGSDYARHSEQRAGTVHWWPPETFQQPEEAFQVLAAHDVWSLGVTVIEMLSGHPPYHQLSVEVFTILMSQAPDTYHSQLPIARCARLFAACLAWFHYVTEISDVNLNSLLRAHLTTNHQQSYYALERWCGDFAALKGSKLPH